MTFEEKLDAILDGFSYSLINTKHPENSNTGHLFDQMCEILHLKVTPVETILLKNRLLADGQIEPVRKDIDFPLFRMTASGLNFIINGGYAHRDSPGEAKAAEVSTNKELPKDLKTDIPFISEEPAEELNAANPSSDKESKSEPQPGTRPFLNAQQTAALLGIKISTLYGKVHRKEIPFYKNGNMLHFKEDELIALLKSGRKLTIEEIKEGARKSLHVKKGSK